VCQKIQDGTHFSPQTSTGAYRYVTSKNIRNGYLDLTASGWISKEEHDGIYKRADVKFGDVLLTKDGANAGNVAINSIEEPFSLLSSVAFIRPDPKMLLSRYLFEYLRSAYGRTRILSHVKGSAITRLTLIQIKNLEVPSPPLVQQANACEHFMALERAIACARIRMDRLSELRFDLATEVNRS
jgi:type I restriction enzyme S subunit